MQDQSIVRIPLRGRGGIIRGYAIIDAADVHLVSHWQWSFDNGYAQHVAIIDGRKVKFYLHRVLLGLAHGDTREGDHIDRDRLNCRRSNLRIVTHNGNKQNRSPRPGASSIYRGVSWDNPRSKWIARIWIDGRTINLGGYSSESEAAEVAKAARSRLMPYSVD